jgi:hypothetical protein
MEVVDCLKASPVLRERLMRTSGSPRSIFRKGLLHSAKVEVHAIVNFLGGNLVKQVWDRYRELERELNERAKETIIGFRGPKPLDYFLGKEGVYRGQAPPQVIRIFDDIYSKVKHIAEPSAVEADESTKKRAVELEDDISRLESLLNKFMKTL